MIMKILALLLTVTFMVTIGSQAYMSVLNESFGIYRLRTDVFPKKYHVEITPYFTDEIEEVLGLFNGISNIIFTTSAKDNVYSFILNSEDLHIQNVKLTHEYRPINFNCTYIKMDSILLFLLAERMVPNTEYEIELHYSGAISDGNEGLIQRHYTDEAGNNKTIIALNLQPTNSRKVFPCFDDPRFKAEFQITATPTKNYTTLSHLEAQASGRPPIITHGKPHNRKRLLSTYSASIAITDFVEHDWGVILLYTQNYSSHSLRISPNLPNDLLRSYNTIFSYEYVKVMQVGHLYIIGVPNLGHRGGFSSWGALMLDAEYLSGESRDETTVRHMQSTIMVMSREMAHQWLGHAISVEWWSYNWLMESFATYYVYFGTPSVYAKYGIEMESQFLLDLMHKALEIDYRNITRPLTDRTIVTPSDIAATNYDIITTGKGAAFIRMLRSCMGENAFNQILPVFLRKRLYGVANENHLLTQVKNFFPQPHPVNIEEFFHDWTEQIGYPVIIVYLSTKGDSVELHQERYVPMNNGSDVRFWYTIPITYTTNRDQNFLNTTPSLYFPKNKHKITIKLETSTKWLMLNIQQVGFYRVRYQRRVYNYLRTALFQNKWCGIHELNRVQYIDDLLSYGEHGIFYYNEVFRWLEYLCTETHYAPWKAALTRFKAIASHLTIEEQPYFGIYIFHVTDNIYAMLNFNVTRNNSAQDNYLRNEILEINCRYQRRSCLRIVRKMFQDYLHRGIAIPVEIRATVLCAAVRNGTLKDYSDLHKKYNYARGPMERQRIRFALACVRHPEKVKHFFEFVLSSRVPLMYKVESMLPLFEQNQENVWPVYQLFTSRFDEMVTVFQDPIVVINLIGNVTFLFTTHEEKADFQEFISRTRPKLGTKAKHILDKAFEEVHQRLRWNDRYLPPLRRYLQSERWKTCAASSSFYLGFVTMVCLVRTIQK